MSITYGEWEKMKEYRYSIAKALFSEGITYDESTRLAQTEFPNIPVDSMDFIYTSRAEKWEPRYWERGWGYGPEDVMAGVLTSMDYWFEQNPKAAALVKEKLASTVAKKGKKMSSAIPLFPDSGSETRPEYVMYMGQIVPPELIRGFKQFIKVTERGAKAEDAFRNWLVNKGLYDAKVIAGSANPDVVSKDMKFEVGSGSKKRLHLGSKDGKVGTVVYPRREAFDRHSDPNGSRISPEGVLEIWQKTGYDFLVQDWGKQWAIFSLSAGEHPQAIQNALGGRPKQLTSSMCKPTLPQLNDNAWEIKYTSLDWEQSTKITK